MEVKCRDAVTFILESEQSGDTTLVNDAGNKGLTLGNTGNL